MLYFWIKTSLGVLLTVNFFLPFYTVVSNRHLHDEPMAALAGNLSLNGMLLGLTSHCGPASQFRANLIARATFINLLARWLNASEIV